MGDAVKGPARGPETQEMEMAKPISATPVIKGKDAERIAHEIRHGTPNTPERVRMIREADSIYARYSQKQGRERTAKR